MTETMARLLGPKGQEVRILPYHELYRTQVISLWTDAFSFDNAEIFNRDIDIARDRKPCLFQVAVEGNELLGTCVGAMDGHRSWIYYLSVVDRARRMGIGSTLLGSVEDLLRRQGSKQLGLHVRKMSTDAIMFYRRRGYFREEAISMGKTLD